MTKSKKNHNELVLTLEQKKRDLHFTSHEDLFKYLKFLKQHNLLDKELEETIL